MRDPFRLDSRFRGNDGKKSGNDTSLVILNRKRSASDWGSRDYRLDSRFRGNDRRGAGMTRVGAGMTKRRYGNDGRNKNNDR